MRSGEASGFGMSTGCIPKVNTEYNNGITPLFAVSYLL
jgi:hypothetical protein